MEKINCPNCGASITEEKCPYCGTMFYDFSAMSTTEPFYLKIKHENKIIRLKVQFNGLEMTSYATTSIYADNEIILNSYGGYPNELNLSFNILSHKNDQLNRDDVIMEKVDLEEIEPGTIVW